MKTEEIKIVSQRYFNGESSTEDEQILKSYFAGSVVDKEFEEYAEFFGGISELSESNEKTGFEEEIMDYILEHENSEKTRFRKMWITVTGVAASIIIVLGTFLIYQEQQKPFTDTYKNPEQAYAVAEQTLQFVGAKYNKGLAELSNFRKLDQAQKTLRKSVVPVNIFYEGIEKMEETEKSNQKK